MAYRLALSEAQAVPLDQNFLPRGPAGLTPTYQDHSETPTTIQPWMPSAEPRGILDHHIAQAPPRRYEGTLFAPNDAEYLESCGFLAPGRTPGFRILHKRMLSSTSHAEYSNISLDIRADTPWEDDAFEEVPLELISPETLEYVGFTGWRAGEPWDRWNRSSYAWRLHPPRFEGDEERLARAFMDFMLGAVNSTADTRRGAEADDEWAWRTCLALVGVNRDRQEAIMNPRHRETRCSRTCLYWVEDTIRWRFNSLVEMGRCSRERDEMMREFTTVPELGGLRNLGHGGESRSVDSYYSDGGLAAGVRKGIATNR